MSSFLPSITSMQPEDFSWAKELGYHISLLGVYKDLEIL